MGEWHDTGIEDEHGSWQCISPYVEIGEASGAPLPNQFAYYVVGRADGPRYFKLSLKVSDLPSKSAALKALSEHAAVLSQKALGVELPARVRDDILKARDGSSSVAGHELRVERSDFAPGGIAGGFNLRFKIEKRP